MKPFLTTAAACLLLCFQLGAQDFRLSNRYVVSISTDRYGDVWIATEEGLNRYDGVSNTIFYKEEGGLSSNQLNCVVADRKDPLVWIGTQRAGLDCYDLSTGTFTSYTHDLEDSGSLINNDVTDIHQDEDGNIWLSSFPEGIDRLNKTTGKFTHFNHSTLEGIRIGNIHRFLVRDDHLYIGYWDGGLGIVSLKDGSAQDFRHDPNDPSSLPSDGVRALFFDNYGNLWVGTTEGLALYSGAESSFVVFKHDVGDPHSIPEGPVSAISMTPDGQLLVGTGYGGAATLNIKDAYFTSGHRPFERLPLENKRTNLSVRYVLFDDYSNLWIGTYGDGIIFQSGKDDGLKRISYPSGLSSNAAMALDFDRDGRLLVGNNAGNLDILDGGNSPFNPQSVTLAGGVRAAHVDSDGKVWLGCSGDGIFIWDGGTKRHLDLGNHLTVNTFYEDDDVIWVGTDSGLYKLSKSNGSLIRRYTIDDGLSDNLVMSVVKDGEDRLWVGTFGRGVVIFNDSMHFLDRRFNGNGLPSSSVNQMIVDGKGAVWVATNEGLVEFAEGYETPTQVFGREDGLDNSFIRALATDRDGNLWMSTNVGISCLTPDRLIINFNDSSSLPDGNYIGGAVAVSPDGGLFFGNTEGIAVIDPEILLEPKVLPDVVFRTDAKDLAVDHKHNYISVSFCVPDYSFSHSVQYSYRITDLDATWRECGNTISFDQLPYGKHRLEVRARLNNQPWGRHVSSAILTIKPPIWLTWWAKLLYVLMAIAAVYCLIRLRVRRARKEGERELERQMLLNNQRLNDERMKFFTNITHELRTPLTLIMGPLEDLSSDTLIPPAARTRIGKVKQGATDLLSLVNKILDFRKTETSNKHLSVGFDNLSSVVEEEGNKFKDLSDNSNVIYKVSVEPGIKLWFDREAIKQILDNLLSNARKYTSSGQIGLSLAKESDGKVRIKVSDTGYGISKEAQEHIFDRFYQAGGPHQASGTGIGLSLVQNLCLLHKIDIGLDSTEGIGTTFTLTLDPDEQYPDAEHIEIIPEETDDTAQEDFRQDDDRALILVVEDNTGICDYIRESLSDNYRVITAHNGKEGLKAALKSVPDVIISDIMMPVMDGIDLCKAIKNDIATSHIPVILLTAKTSVESRKEGYDVGADSYIVKPFNKDLLASRIQNILTNRTRLAGKVVEGGASSELSPIDNSFLKKFTDEVYAGMSDENMDVASLSEKMCMSTSTLYRKIKGLTGISPNEYIRGLRLSKAAELLKTTDLTISQIGWQIGIGNTVYFRNCFKERYGMTPSAYREQK